MDNFFNTLFNPGEKTCFSKDIYGTTLSLVSNWEYLDSPLYFSINPMADKRADKNVVAYRNILVEFDKMPIEEQRNLVEALGLPYSTCVFSGKKSHHYIISLADDVTADERMTLTLMVYEALKTHVDHSCKNPSRFTRMPGAWRIDTGKTQDLIEVRDRIKNQELHDWLKSKKIEKPRIYPKQEPIGSIKVDGKPIVDSSSPEWFTDIFLNRKTRHFLECGADEGDRHYMIKCSAFDFRNVGKSKEEAKRRLYFATDKPKSEVEKLVDWVWLQQ